MERFTERDIKLWREWMDGENSYTQGDESHPAKFTAEEQSKRITEGILKDSPSFGEGANGRLRRFLSTGPLLREAPLKFEEVKYKVVRDLGKSAHNHYVALVFLAHTFRGEPLEGAFSGVLDGLEAILSANAQDPLLLERFTQLDLTLGGDNIAAFQMLQSLQDRGDIKGLEDGLYDQTAKVHAGFIAVASEFGWPEPGVDSTLDANPWSITV